jgi:hypothetical protein
MAIRKGRFLSMQANRTTLDDACRGIPGARLLAGRGAGGMRGPSPWVRQRSRRESRLKAYTDRQVRVGWDQQKGAAPEIGFAPSMSCKSRRGPTSLCLALFVAESYQPRLRSSMRWAGQVSVQF